MKTQEVAPPKPRHVAPDRLKAKALVRYNRDCEALGYFWQQPGDIDVHGDTVNLSNGHGILASYAYRVDHGGAVRFQSQEVTLV